MVAIGQTHRFLPGQYDDPKIKKDHTQLGTVVYINKPHKYFILETVTETGSKYRESFKFSQVHKGLVR